jgi:hypothetical protein
MLDTTRENPLTHLNAAASAPRYTRDMGNARLSIVVCAAGLAGCLGSNPSTPPNYLRGPNYSSTSCFDNCGQDAACQATCTNSVSTTPLVPGGTQPGTLGVGPPR